MTDKNKDEVKKIKVVINKRKEELDDGTTVEELLKAKSLKKAAVWVNGTQVKAFEYSKYTFEDKDHIRLLKLA